MARINRANALIRVIRITISEDAVSLRAFLVIRLGNHLSALISAFSESVPISDHQWLKTPLFGHSVAAAPRWVIRGQPGSSDMFQRQLDDSLKAEVQTSIIRGFRGGGG